MTIPSRPGRPLAHGAPQRKRAIFLDDDRAAWVASTHGRGHLSEGVRVLIDQARPSHQHPENPMIPFCDCPTAEHSGDWIAGPQTGGQIVDMEVCASCGRAILGTQSTHTAQQETHP